ncbi:unnamed protein product [Leptidea sinapis]|uniref:Hyaluronidase n=1 Tax=Leptidea sinapis TaxID=189913 RepID=A0A5E4Q399_9NEOP|nr:unnamed protein product [Leptidea sinapis]
MKPLFLLYLASYIAFCAAESDKNYFDVDDKIVRKKPFQVYWNVPTRQCKDKNIPFNNLEEKYGIIQNRNDAFEGDRITILYHPGLIPAILDGKLINGGVPQEGSLSKHLDQLRKDIYKKIPDPDFNDDKIVRKKPFQVYWNVPTRQCKDKNIPFNNLEEKYGIIQNRNDAFEGDRITILYHPGLIPAILDGKLINGGVPQEGSLSKHLDQLRKDIYKKIPDPDFNGPSTSLVAENQLTSTKPFKVYWNVPTMKCVTQNIYFDYIFEKFGIIPHTQDEIVMLLKPGNFPSISLSSGEVFNGGVPQNGDLDRYLAAFMATVDYKIPNANFTGIAVIDFGEWRPLLNHNVDELQRYKDKTNSVEAELHPAWPNKWITYEV